MPKKYNHVVVALKESKDLNVRTTDELLGSLKSHEDRINGREERNTENAFHTKLQFSKPSFSNNGSNGQKRQRGYSNHGKKNRQRR